MSWWSRLGVWWNDPSRKLRKRAQRELDRLFVERRDLLRKTSLRPEHRGRTQVLDVLDEPLRVFFGIVRHPRPYAFSSQHHEVLEMWCWHAEEDRLERLKGKNLTRFAGLDDSPTAF